MYRNTQGDRSMARPNKSTKASNYMSVEEEEMDAELWYACAGPQHTLPPVNSLVAYFPQGHIEQVASFNNPDVDGYVPRYELPAAIPCMLNDIRLSADRDTDEVFATVLLCPVSDPTEPSYSLETPAPPKRKSVCFTKTLTISDTSTHGGFSVPRRGAEDCFPPLDKSQDNPTQDLIAKDLHGIEWTFKHLFRGQPKRHLLTTGWSVFVSQKRLVAGDAVLFLRGEDGQLRIAVRLAPRQQKLQSIMVTTPTMAIGVLEAAAHADSEKSRFSLIYNPRSCPSQFVIPYSKYVNALKNNFTKGQRVKSEYAVGDTKSLTTTKNGSSQGNRSRTRFESEDSSDSRLLGTITKVSDYDNARWPGSVWRSIEVKWDESSSERMERVSPWEVNLFSQRVSQPASYASKRRTKAPSQLQTSHFDQPINLPPLNYARHDVPAPPSSYRGSELQDFLGPRNGDHSCQGESQGFGMRIFETYKDRCSPQTGTFASYGVKAEPCGEADLHLGVSTVTEDQTSSKSSVNQQPSFASIRVWLPSPRPQMDNRTTPNQGRPGCTDLSMSNLPPSDSGSSSQPAAPLGGFWANQTQTTKPSHGERKCRIFGVSLDRPATPPESREDAHQQGPCHETSRNVENGGPGSMTSSSMVSPYEAWSRHNEPDWQQNLVQDQRDFQVAERSSYNRHGDMAHDRKMYID